MHAESVEVETAQGHVFLPSLEVVCNNGRLHGDDGGEKIGLRGRGQGVVFREVDVVRRVDLDGDCGRVGRESGGGGVEVR